MWAVISKSSNLSILPWHVCIGFIRIQVNKYIYSFRWDHFWHHRLRTTTGNFKQLHMTQNGPLEPLRVERTKLSAKFRARCRDAKTNRLWWLAVISSASSWPSRSTPCSTLSKSATKPFLQPTQHKKVGNFECSSLFDSWRGEKQHRCQLAGIFQRHEMQTRYQWLGNSTIQKNPFHPDRLTRPIIPSQICLICAVHWMQEQSRITRKVSMDDIHRTWHCML